MNTPQITARLIVTYLACLSLLAANLELCESRYLPTRSDDSDIGILRDILERLVEESSASRRFSSNRANEWTNLSPLAPTAFGWNDKQDIVASLNAMRSQPKLVRRSHEQAVASDNGVGNTKEIN